MTKRDQQKLKKALKLMEEAKSLINKVENNDKKFMYDSNCNFRTNRINAAVKVIENSVEEYCLD